MNFFQKSKTALGIFIAGSLFLAGCASYQATPLTNVLSFSDGDGKGINVFAKALTKEECKKFFDRNIIAKGYQPIALKIENFSASNFLFDPAKVSLPQVSSQSVAKKVHTSTVGRVIGYLALAPFTFGLTTVAAIIDGIGSSAANRDLDKDFAEKTAKAEVVSARTIYEKVIFVPLSQVKSPLVVELMDMGTQENKILNVNIL